MSNNKTRILAIDPGTRNIGIALLDDGRLIYYGVKTIREATSPKEILEEGRKTILRLMRDFKPHVLSSNISISRHKRGSEV